MSEDFGSSRCKTQSVYHRQLPLGTPEHHAQEDKEKLQLKQAIQLQQRQGQARILSELMAYFESHPSEASFMLANIKAGHMDFNNETPEQEQRLPGHMNEVKLLSKEDTDSGRDGN